MTDMDKLHIRLSQLEAANAYLRDRVERLQRGDPDNLL